MNARDQIFKSLENFKDTTPLEIQTFTSEYKSIKDEFVNNATLAGAIVYYTQEEIEKFNIISIDDCFEYRSNLGVAENGALWCYNLKENRHKLFSSTNLIIHIDEKQIVPNMHDAYACINLNDLEFGTFISGPSKTADIEQSLVIGAHGSMSLHILIHSS